MFTYLLDYSRLFSQHSCSCVHVMPYSCTVPSHAAANTYYTNTHLHVNCCFTSTLDLLCPSSSPNLPLPLIVTQVHTCTGDIDIYVTHRHSYPHPPTHTTPTLPPTHPNTTHLWLFPGRLPSVQSLRKEEVAIFLNGQKDEASHQRAQIVDHIVYTCTQTHAPLVPKQMPHESETMRTLLHIHAKNRI